MYKSGALEMFADFLYSVLIRRTCDAVKIILDILALRRLR